MASSRQQGFQDVCIQGRYIEGRWKHADKHAWISFQTNQGLGHAYVSRHDQNPEVEGELLIKHIERVNDNGWRGEMFNGEGFTTVTIRCTNTNTLIIRTLAEAVVLRLLRD
ncbi:MAG: hypothetical protein AAF541_00680 [Pseudomonadota bacterium]